MANRILCVIGAWLVLTTVIAVLAMLVVLLSSGSVTGWRTAFVVSGVIVAVLGFPSAIEPQAPPSRDVETRNADVPVRRGKPGLPPPGLVGWARKKRKPA